ncbi:MAG TPA: HAMP domain-containing protein [Rhodospirillales bacterium]|nr:HAMP domain-containing protein [Rhodospirillales bacterium]HIL75683.1 HAMP domain-containing protein [Rhodospirillales bacterium]
MIKHFLPKSLLGRSILIIVIPLILLQLVSAFVFYESHWHKVSLRLARGVVGDIAAVVDLLAQNNTPKGRAAVLDLASTHFAFGTRILEGEVLSNDDAESSVTDPAGSVLLVLMREAIRKPLKIDSNKIDKHVVISIQLSEGVLEVVSNRKRIFSSTTYVFVLWMVGTAMILFGVATAFMRNQVRPIRRLAVAADDFGKGRDNPLFKPEGASEVRQAASAFISMRDRIQRQINQRTEMLSGVSHDLRTPLTRMKLALEMKFEQNSIQDLKEDITEMEHMLEAYLAFARGEGDETPSLANLSAILRDVVNSARRNGATIDLHTEGSIQVPLRPRAFKRCVANLVENADRYADHVSLRAGQRGQVIEIIVDDDGPGIPEKYREDAFRPFYRLENSRNPETGGVGLGLSIARDIIRGHGGDILLSDSPTGGLRAKLTVPL